MPTVTVTDIAGDTPIGSFEIQLDAAGYTAASLIRAKVEAEHRKVTDAFAAQSGMMAKLAEALSGELEPMIAQSMTAFESRAFTLTVDGIEIVSPDQPLAIRDGSIAVFQRPDTGAASLPPGQ